MKTTPYFNEQVLRKRPYLTLELCEAVVAAPVAKHVQPDGRVRHWRVVADPRDGAPRALRVVVLEDGETIHNAFFDRNFEPPP
jgi:hypothetical protein